MAKKIPIVRMNLEMSPKVRQRLEYLSAETDLSLSEVLRKSLAVLDLLHKEVKGGAKVILRSDDGERELVII